MPDWFELWWAIIIVVVPALWVAYTYFDTRRREKRKDTQAPAEGEGSVMADRRGIAIGRDARDSTITTNRPPDDPAA